MPDNQDSLERRHRASSSTHLLLTYVADLELEVDRLRKRGQFLHHEARATVRRIQQLCAHADQPESLAVADRVEVEGEAKKLAAILDDLRETPGYHPAHDQVLALAVRPLVEQLFRSQQRLFDGPKVALRLELDAEHVDWFPGRLRHILDNLLSNALKYRDPAKEEQWVVVRLETRPAEYEFRVSDNGLGLSDEQRDEFFQVFSRTAPGRAAGLGVGLAVVKLLVNQCGGSLCADSGEGHGSTFTAVLPRYEVDDYLV